MNEFILKCILSVQNECEKFLNIYIFNSNVFVSHIENRRKGLVVFNLQSAGSLIHKPDALYYEMFGKTLLILSIKD